MAESRLSEGSAAPLRYKGRRLGRLIVTTCHNGTGAPLVDDSFIRDQEGNEYVGWSVLLTPWRKNEYGEHLRQRALTIGWRRG